AQRDGVGRARADAGSAGGARRRPAPRFARRRLRARGATVPRARDAHPQGAHAESDTARAAGRVAGGRVPAHAFAHVAKGLDLRALGALRTEMKKAADEKLLLAGRQVTITNPGK